MFFMRWFLFYLFTASFLFAVPVEKAAKYHELLLKNADNEVLMKRFLEAWLDEQDREALEQWLEAEAEAGEKLASVAERRILARYLDHIGAQERALEEYERVLKVEPSDSLSELAVARLQAVGLDFEGALKTLGAREDVEAVTLRGSYEHRLGNTKKALELWRGLLDEKPRDRELREDLVRLFRQEGLGKEARELQQELLAMEDDPFQRALDQLELGDIQLEAELKDAALASYRQVLGVSGSDSWMEREALYKVREVFRRERDADGLRAFLAQMREEMPHRLALRKSYARQLVVTGEVDEGMAAFREVLRRSPGDEAQRMEFIELLAFAERYEEAAAELEVLIEREATVERWLRLAELKKNIDDDELLEALSEVEKLKGDNAVAVLELARIYARFNLNEEALRVLEAGHNEYADSREIAEALAVLLVELKRADEALVIWLAMAEKGGVEEALKVAQSQRRHGLIEDAFLLLEKYRQELGGTFEGLCLYCELALAAEEVDAAWTGVQQLFTLPMVFSDLQVAVNLGSQIGRKIGLEAAISDLEDVEEENALCFLATLQQLDGRLAETDAVLAQVEGELARRHRIVLLTKRGDYDGAVVQLREMIGERASLAQRKQLIELLERKGDYAGALVEAEQWKVSSPGEVQVWRKRADLLVLLRRDVEAEEELRRARNIFGRDDVELTRELAKMQLPLGRHLEAFRLYEHLFRTAQTNEARLKHVAEMYAAAVQAGVQEEMIARFKKEHTAAKQELFPLRLLAQLYKLSRDFGGQQEVLLKLHRLLPDDEGILFELVALAELNNDLAGARELLLSHAARTRSAGTLQRLAAMQFKSGEVDAGLQILSKIAPGELTASGVEMTALLLWKLGEHQLVLRFLAENEAVVNGDWQLRSLRSDFLEIVGRTNEAQEIWVELLKVEGGVGRPVFNNGYRTIYFPATGPILEQNWRQLIMGIFIVDPSGKNRLDNQPSSVNEVRWLSLARLAKAHLQADPSGESWQPFLETLDYPWLREVREWGVLPKKVAPSLAVLLEGKDAEVSPGERLQNLIDEPEATREDFLKLAIEVAGANPGVAKICRIHAAFKLPEGDGKLAELREVAARITEDEQGGVNHAMQFASLVYPQWQYFGLLPSLQGEPPSYEQQEKLKLLEPYWQSRIERAMTERLKGTIMRDVLLSLSLQRLSGDLEGFFENLEKMLALDIVAQPIGKPTLRYSYPLGGLPTRDVLLSHLASQNVVYGLVNQARIQRMLSPELLEKARGEGWLLGDGKELEEFAKRIPKVKDGVLRAFLFQKIGLEQEFLTELESLAQKGSLELKLDTLALRYGTDQWEEKEKLLKALLVMDRAGLSSAELSLLDGVTLGEARKNRRLKEMSSEMKNALTEVLERFSKSRAGRLKASTLSALYRPLGVEAPSQSRQNGGTQSRQSYRQLLGAEGGVNARKKENEQERIERFFFEQLKRNFSYNSVIENFGRLKQFVKEERYSAFQAKALALYEPGESLSYFKRIRYAQLCLAYGDLEKAQKEIVQLQAERVYESELDVLFLLTQEPSERAARLDDVIQNEKVAKAIRFLMAWSQATEDEETFFDVYERLIVLMQNRVEEFSLQDASEIFQIFNRFETLSKRFEKRSLRSLRSRLPRIKKGEDWEEGDWVLRSRQHQILIEAYGEMLRLQSIRGQVLVHIQRNMEGLRLDNEKVAGAVFEALEKEPVTEVDSENTELLRAIGLMRSAYSSHSSNVKNGSGYWALKAVLNSEQFSEESVEQLVRHVFLSEKQGALVKAALKGDEVQVETLLVEYWDEEKVKLRENFQQEWERVLPESQLHDLPQRWGAFLDNLLRSKRWTKPVREMLAKGVSSFKGERESRRSELLRVCELGDLDESLAVLEAVMADYFPVAAMHESYQDLKEARAVPSEVARQINAGQSLFKTLQTVPRAWIPLLTFLEKSEQSVWVTMDEKKIRSQLQRRLDVMYKTVFYDRLREEGFSSYDGLALLGAERFSVAGEDSSYLEGLISPLKLAPTEGKTYWLQVSEDCRAQVEGVTYLEAFIAMRKDFKIDDEGRQEFLRKVLESELKELSGLSDEQLRGLANFMERDFPECEVPEASEELENFLIRLRGFPGEGIVDRVRRMISDEKALTVLDDNGAKGLCARLAEEQEVELAAEFWVAYLKVKGASRSYTNFSSLNSHLLKWKPFIGALDLIDSVRFVRLVHAALHENPEMAESISYTRSMLRWSEKLRPYSARDADPAGVIPFLDEALQRDGVTEIDKRVVGGFLVKANLSGRSDKTSNEVFRLGLAESNLAVHSPGIVEMMLALSQLQGEREREGDAKALKVIYDYIQDQELAPDFRADLAKWMIGEFSNDATLLDLADAEPIGVALRDLLMRGSYKVTDSLDVSGPMMYFINQQIDTVPLELQREIYEAWAAAMGTDAKAILTKRFRTSRSHLLFEVIFDFIDGGKRFPIPQPLIDVLDYSFSGNLDLIQKLIRSGNDELVINLLPDANERFRIYKSNYSAVTQELENEVFPKLPAKHQLLLKCYLAGLTDNYKWKKLKESEGYLQKDRAVAAAKLFVADPPDEQVVRLRAIEHLEDSVEALAILMPLFADELKNDLVVLSQEHRGEIRYMLSWLQAGGVESIQLFSPRNNQPLRMHGLREYDERLAELEGLLAPSLNALEKMRLTCYLALLRDPREETVERGEFLTRDIRMKQAARYILENPLADEDREEEKKCIMKLVKGGLPEVEVQALMQRDLKRVEKIDAAMLAELLPADIELLAYQLRASLGKGSKEEAMNCLRVLADTGDQISERQREQLINVVLPKIALPLIAHITQQEVAETQEEVLTELKGVGSKLFTIAFSGKAHGEIMSSGSAVPVSYTHLTLPTKA